MLEGPTGSCSWRWAPNSSGHTRYHVQPMGLHHIARFKLPLTLRRYFFEENLCFFIDLKSVISVPLNTELLLIINA